MKAYFSFTLSGKRLFPIWLIFLAFVVVPYCYFISRVGSVSNRLTGEVIIGLLCSLLVMFALAFYILKLLVGSLSLCGRSLEFKGGLVQLVKRFLSGYFLSIITFGIYTPWFVKNLAVFVATHVQLGGKNFQFNGEASRLFIILMFAFFVPCVAVTLVMAQVLICSSQEFCIVAIQLLFVFMMIPCLYSFYHWMVNFSYKNYTVGWVTDFFPSVTKVSVEVFLTIITFGVYMPLAYFRIYKYFIDRTVAISYGRRLQFGYDLDQGRMFFFAWRQFVLSVISLGLYFPWAFAKVSKRMLSLTYARFVEVEY